MPPFTAKYSQEQRDAFLRAHMDRGITAQRVSELAAAGELKGQDGPIDPFELPPSTILGAARRIRLQRAGKVRSDLAAEPPRDAVEALRRRLVNLADRELADTERRRAGTVEPERIRQLVRVVRELASIPGPNDQRPPQPGTRGPGGKKDGAETRGGLAGQLLRAHAATQTAADAQTTPAQNTPHPDNTTRTTQGAAPHNETQKANTNEGGHGLWSRGVGEPVLPDGV